MTLQQLKYAIEIAKFGSISEAAKNLFVSQPSLSKAIKELETELKLTIFIRTNKGITISNEGTEFLGYARQVVEQNQLLEEKYLGVKDVKQRFSVSTQHYSFAVNAFVDIIEENNIDQYDFTLRETRTSEIIDDVKNLVSEIGVLYLNDFNEKVIGNILEENELEFEELFETKPYVFISFKHPLAQKDIVTMEDLKEYPCLSFEQGDKNSFYYSEEILSTVKHKKDIRVSDRATLFNLLIGLNGYTICTGIISKELNGKDIIAVPLDEKEYIRVGIIKRKNIIISQLGQKYIEAIKHQCKIVNNGLL